MGRQRTINDQKFWRNPLLQNCSTEDRVALLHLLSSPDSNIVGAYPIVPRIAGAEIGWTLDQWHQVIERLKTQGLVWFEANSMFVWIKIWWDHHNCSQVMGPKLRNRTLEDIKNLPTDWQEAFLHDFRQRISKTHRTWLDLALNSDHPSETIPISYADNIEASSSFSEHNINSNINSKITSTLDMSLPQLVDNSKIPEAHRAEINLALSKSQLNGVAKVQPQLVINALARQFQSNSHPPRSPGAMAYYLSQHLQKKTDCVSQQRDTHEKLSALKGHCYAWPITNPTTYVRIGEHGEYEQFAQEDGKFVRRVGQIDNCTLLDAIRDNLVQEISSSQIEEITCILTTV